MCLTRPCSPCRRRCRRSRSGGSRACARNASRTSPGKLIACATGGWNELSSRGCRSRRSGHLVAVVGVHPVPARRACITVAALNDSRVPTLRRTPLPSSRTLEPIAPQATTTARGDRRSGRRGGPGPRSPPIVDDDPARMAIGHHARDGPDRLGDIGLERRGLAVYGQPQLHTPARRSRRSSSEQFRGQRRVNPAAGDERAPAVEQHGHCRVEQPGDASDVERPLDGVVERASSPGSTGAPSPSQRASVSPRSMSGSSSRKQMQLLISVVAEHRP